MKIKILHIESRELIDAEIIERIRKLPSVTDGWRFNFSKHSISAGANSYVLCKEETPEAIEGCLIYKMLDKSEPYMAYIEIAPHNRGENKIYDLVAGCLIAFACRLSFLRGKGPYKGWLAFDVHEESDEQQKKLMEVYSKKYRAQRFQNSTTMLIEPVDGQNLIEKYLENPN